MDKVQWLKVKAAEFRALLEAYQDTSVDAMLMLKWLTPLFDDISAGRVMPPVRYEFRNALGKDNPFYEPDSIFSGPHADFAAALEDWASQPWYQKMLESSAPRKGEP